MNVGKIEKSKIEKVLEEIQKNLALKKTKLFLNSFTVRYLKSDHNN